MKYYSRDQISLTDSLMRITLTHLEAQRIAVSYKSLQTGASDVWSQITQYVSNQTGPQSTPDLIRHTSVHMHGAGILEIPSQPLSEIGLCFII